MPRKKRGDVKRIVIEMDMDNPAHRQIWEAWQKMSEGGEAARWARAALAAALPSSTILGFSVQIDPDLPPNRVELRTDKKTVVAHHIYVDPTPAQKIAARKAAAPPVPGKLTKTDPEESA